MKNRLEIKTGSKNITASLIATLVITVLSFLSVISGTSPLLGMVIFVLCIWVLFSYFPKAMRNRLRFILTPKCIEYASPYGSIVIPWGDVEKIGIVERSVGANHVGIRLKTYDHVMDGMSKTMARHLKKMLWLEKGLSIIISNLDIPAGVKLWSKLTNNFDYEEMEKELGEIWDLFGYMLYRRKHYGFDIIFDWADLDRSPSMFVQLLQEYRGLAKGGNS